MARALFFVGLVCLAFIAAGAASVETNADDAVLGRQLLGGEGPQGGGPPQGPGQWVWLDQSAFQASGNFAKGSGTANQQSSNQLNQQQGDKNKAQNGNWQSIQTGRKLLKGPQGGGPPQGPGQWVWLDQSAAQLSGNFAKGSGTANQQSSNQLNQQQGDKNKAWNSNSQSIDTGRKLLGGEGPQGGGPPQGPGQWVWLDQSAFQASGNFAKGSGTANQQSSNQLNQQQGDKNKAGNQNNQSIDTKWGP